MYPILEKIAAGEARQDAAFSAAAGLYWYCADYHAGLDCPLYAILCTVGYEPGPLESGTGDDLVAAEVYDNLLNRSIDPEELADEIYRTLAEG